MKKCPVCSRIFNDATELCAVDDAKLVSMNRGAKPNPLAGLLSGFIAVVAVLVVVAIFVWVGATIISHEYHSERRSYLEAQKHLETLPTVTINLGVYILGAIFAIGGVAFAFKVLSEWIANRNKNLSRADPGVFSETASEESERDKVLKLLRDHTQGITAEIVHKAGVAKTAGEARDLLARLEIAGLLTGRYIASEAGGHTIKLFKKAGG